MDGITNTAAVLIFPDLQGRLRDEIWQRIFDVDISGNYMFVDEGCGHLRD